MKIQDNLTKLNISIQKSHTPIIFLDSNYIIEFNKVLMSKSENIKFERLFDILNILASEQLIQCPIADQELEVGYGKNKEQNPLILAKLSNGIKFKNFVNIETLEQRIFFDAFIHSVQHIVLDYQLGLKNTKSPDISIIITDDDILALQKMKLEIAQKMNNLKADKKNLSFDKLLKDEIYSEGRTFIRYLKGREMQPIPESFYKGIIEMYDDIVSSNNLTVNEETLQSFVDFLFSDYWIEVPYCYIKKSLFASMLFSDRKFKKSDYMDISNACHFLPFCNVFLTDKHIANCMIELGLDRKYNTSIFSSTNIDELIYKLEHLAGVN